MPAAGPTLPPLVCYYLVATSLPRPDHHHTTASHRTALQHIDTGSSKPLVDLCAYGFVFAYALSWPRDYAHHMHEQEAKLKGGAHH